jgi:hypothetical protein
MALQRGSLEVKHLSVGNRQVLDPAYGFMAKVYLFYF